MKQTNSLNKILAYSGIGGLGLSSVALPLYYWNQAQAKAPTRERIEQQFWTCLIVQACFLAGAALSIFYLLGKDDDDPSKEAADLEEQLAKAEVALPELRERLAEARAKAEKAKREEGRAKVDAIPIK